MKTPDESGKLQFAKRTAACAFVITAALTLGGVAYAELSSHSNEIESGVPSDPTYATAYAAIFAGVEGTYPDANWSARTPTNADMVTASVLAADGTVLEAKASDYGLSANFRWVADVQYELSGEVSMHQYSGQTSPATSYYTSVTLSVGFSNWIGWPAWNTGDSDPKEIRNETGAADGYVVIGANAYKRVAETLENVDHIKVGFLHQVEGEAEVDRAEPIVAGYGQRGDPGNCGGVVELWDYTNPNSPVLMESWPMP